MNEKSYYIPIYQLIIENEKYVLAYLNRMTANTDYPTLRIFFDYINNELEGFFEKNECKSFNLRILYQHYSDGEYYLWDTQTQPTFEKSISKHIIEKMLKDGFNYSIKKIKLNNQTPHILWEEIK